MQSASDVGIKRQFWCWLVTKAEGRRVHSWERPQTLVQVARTDTPKTCHLGASWSCWGRRRRPDLVGLGYQACMFRFILEMRRNFSRISNK